MRTWIVAALAFALGAGGVGTVLLLKDSPKKPVTVATKAPPKPAETPKPVATTPEAPKFPDLPKPPVETPVPISDAPIQPPPLDGKISPLPAAGPGSIGSGPMTPYSPDVPTKLPVADLNADEALARRTILQAGADIVASSDAKDSSGKIGKSLVAEVAPADLEALRKAIRKALGDRAILSEGGTAPGTVAKSAEDALAAAKKKRDQARIDFLPQAPALRQIEEEYLEQERTVDRLRKTTGRTRLNILIRPIL